MLTPAVTLYDATISRTSPSSAATQPAGKWTLSRSVRGVFTWGAIGTATRGLLLTNTLAWLRLTTETDSV